MSGQFVVVRECYDVVSEFPVGFVGFGRPIFAFVQKTFHARMRVEVGPFPMECLLTGPPPFIWIENVGAAEWFRGAEIVYGAYACRKNRQQGNQYERDDGFAQYDKYLS